MTRTFRVAFAFVVLGCASAAAAQQKPQAPTPAQPPAAQTPAPPAPTPATDTAAAYAYQAEGRRDPFLSLVGTGIATVGGAVTHKGEGAAALSVAEISVRGVLQSRGELVAMVHGPDNKTYIVHPGDKLADGTIKSITPQGLVIIQEVNDPLSLVKQREVRKLLRSLEDGKE